MVLLMTASIEAAKISQLVLRDTEKRLKQYCYALQFYIKCRKFNKIVFCDNSNYCYNFEGECALAKRLNVQLEILKYNSDYEYVEKYGKGYGEGEILKYIMDHSQLLEGENYFYKVTGRLIVKNVTVLVKKGNEIARFNRNLYAHQSVDTRFWGMNKKDYENILMESYKKVNDSKGRYLEICYKKDMEYASLFYKPFCAFPRIEGYSGTIGEKYHETEWYTKIVYDLLCRFGMYNSEKGFFIAFLLFNVVIRKRKVIDVYYEYLIYNTN